MDAKTIIKELEETYPDKLIKQLPQNSPTEIVCEFDPLTEHPEYSLAIAVIDRSAPHYHKRMTEIYHVLKGELKLHVDDEEFVMYEGQQYTITPGRIHWAEGNATWVEIYSSPGYHESDHIVV